MIVMWEDDRGWTVWLEEMLLWIMDLYFGQKRLFEVKNVLKNSFL